MNNMLTITFVNANVNDATIQKKNVSTYEELVIAALGFNVTVM